jgi:hypothetical protein
MQAFLLELAIMHLLSRMREMADTEDDFWIIFNTLGVCAVMTGEPSQLIEVAANT